MDNNLSIIFAVILLLGGGLIIGKTLVHRQEISAAASVNCPTSGVVQFTPEVRMYIEQKLPVSSNASMEDTNLLDQINNLEAEVRNIVTSYSKSKEFIARADAIERQMSELVKSREERLEKGRMMHGEQLVNEAAAKCGKPGDIFAKFPKNPGTPPPQAKPAK
jgi:hypothetical protein